MVPPDALRARLACRFVLLSFCICHSACGESSLVDAESTSAAGGRSGAAGGTELTAIAQQTGGRRGRAYRRVYADRADNADDHPHDDDHDHYDDHHGTEDEEDERHGGMKAMVQPKVDYWAGYYDFLINEGSYKFWAVFQLATAILLIYSAFAALYYAKVNPPTPGDDFDDLFRRRRRRRRRRSLPRAARDSPFAGLDAVTFQRIVEAADAERTD